MKKLFLGLILSILTTVFLAPKTFGAQSISIGTPPSTIDQSQDFSLNVSLSSCTGCSDSYLRGIFYPSGTSYFGFTQDNNGNWSNAPASGCTSYFKVAQSDLLSGSWSGTLKFKPDSSSSFYNGPGEYIFKVARYTSSCSSISTSSQEYTVAITGPTPTPTPSPTSSPASIPSPSPIIKSTPIPTATFATQKPLSTTQSTLGAQDSPKASYDFSQSPTSKPSTLVESSNNENKGGIFLTIVFIVGGALLAAAAGWFAFDKLSSTSDDTNQL